MNTTGPFLTLSTESVVPERETPDAGKVVVGQPMFTTWNVEESPDGKLFAGVWEATPGTWSISYDEWEYCRILSGVSIITDNVGNKRRVTAGDSFILQPGFAGTWEVVETTRKEYVIRL
ncbi:cupin domain-containing protein [Tepidamorphus sp. 3E244]|uniref:cupin domain-containing protein n=1 Tax=Tepidamorphus sp. 3E244 TaxID=3385498 RepID=UPI0038FCDAA6